MGEIGYFGDIIFEVSNDKILNFDGFAREAQSKYENHELIGQKPRTEFVAPGLDTVNFTVLLKAQFGVKPRDEMNRWLEYCRGGDAETLVIGGKPLGVDKWVVTSVSQQWDDIFNQGELVSGKVDVTLQEYVTSMWTVQGYRDGLKRIAEEKARQEGLAALKQDNDSDSSLEEFIKFMNEQISSSNPSDLISLSELTDVENLGESIDISGMGYPVLLYYIGKKLEQATGYRLSYSHETSMLSVSNYEKNCEVAAKCVLICDLEVVDAMKILEALEGVANE